VLEAMRGASAEAAHIQQASIATGLEARGHALTYVGPRGLDEVEYAAGTWEPETMSRTWSATRWFDLASRVAWRGQRWLRLPYLNVFSNYRRLDACLRILPGHDVVHERNGLYNLGVAKVCRRLRLPYVLFFDADQIAEQDFMGIPLTGLLRWRAEHVLRQNLLAARCVVCVSEPARASLIQTRHVPAEKVVVFPNAVDVTRFRPSPDARAEIRTELGLGDRPVTIFVGNFYHWHDVATLLDAYARVLTHHPDASLILVGDGPTREAMMKRAAELGIGQAVRFIGSVSHRAVPRFLAAADVALAPVPVMKRDSWLSPMKVFEYLASGLAVIASRTGQIGSVIENDRNGLLVTPGDTMMLAGALSRIIEDRALRVRLGAQARADAIEKHSWGQYVRRLERLYDAVIAGAPVDQI